MSGIILFAIVRKFLQAHSVGHSTGKVSFAELLIQLLVHLETSTNVINGLPDPLDETPIIFGHKATPCDGLSDVLELTLTLTLHMTLSFH